MELHEYVFCKADDTVLLSADDVNSCVAAWSAAALVVVSAADDKLAWYLGPLELDDGTLAG